MYSYGPPHMAVQKQDDQHEHTFSSYVRIRDVVLKIYLGRWTIGRSGERGSGISVLPARYDDDDMKFLTNQIHRKIINAIKGRKSLNVPVKHFLSFCGFCLSFFFFLIFSVFYYVFVCPSPLLAFVNDIFVETLPKKI